MKFRTVVQMEGGLNATGLVVPEDVVAVLGKRAPVVVTVNGYSYRSTIMVMGGQAKLPLALVHRTAAGVEGGQEVEVEVVADTAPREVVVPEDLDRGIAGGGGGGGVCSPRLHASEGACAGGGGGEDGGDSGAADRRRRWSSCRRRRDVSAADRFFESMESRGCDSKFIKR